MSKARAPKRKEEYTYPSSIEVIRDDILEKGTLIETMSRMKFPDAEKVGNAMAQLLDVVEGYELIGKWVSLVTNKEIREVSILAFIILITNTGSLIIRFLQKTLRAVIDCTQKSFKCFETNQDEWRAVNGDGLKLLVVKDLEQYRKKFPNEEDIQEDWSTVIRLPGKYVNSLTAIGGHDRPLIYELRARVVSLRIFVRYQRLMARKIAELFGLNRGARPFYAARCFDELSRGSFSCLLNVSFKTAVSQRHNSIF
jgi:hypothetical protein